MEEEYESWDGDTLVHDISDISDVGGTLREILIISHGCKQVMKSLMWFYFCD